MNERIYGYDLDDVLLARPAPQQKASFLTEKKRVEFQEQMVAFYQTAQVGFNPPEKGFHVLTACRGEGPIRQHVRRWLNVKFPGRVLSVTFMDPDRSLQNVVEFKAAIITRYAITDYCEAGNLVLRALDLKLPNEIRLHHVKGRRDGEVSLFKRKFNQRKDDGPDVL